MDRVLSPQVATRGNHPSDHDPAAKQGEREGSPSKEEGLLTPDPAPIDCEPCLENLAHPGIFRSFQV